MNEKKKTKAEIRYEQHKQLIDEYIRIYKESHKNIKKDIDVIKENFKFVRNDDEDKKDTSWESRICKKYYDRLFKEYALCDMTKYKEGKIGMRWRTEKEVIKGKGQFICANLACDETVELKSYEVNFGYIEHGVKQNALVKIRVCPECVYKLFYKKMKEVEHELEKNKKKKKDKKKKKKSKVEVNDEDKHSHKYLKFINKEYERMKKKKENSNEEIEKIKSNKSKIPTVEPPPPTPPLQQESSQTNTNSETKDEKPIKRKRINKNSSSSSSSSSESSSSESSSSSSSSSESSDSEDEIGPSVNEHWNNESHKVVTEGEKMDQYFDSMFP